MKYSEFANAIDLSALYEAIGFEPMFSHGENDVGKCIFPDNHKHGDQTGKFAIHRGKKVYNCFVCGGGNLVSLVMELQGVEADEATRWLYQFSKSDIKSDADFLDELLDGLGEEKRVTSGLPYFNEKILDKYEDKRDWFIKRGISNHVIEIYQLRWADKAMKAAPRPDLDDYYGPSAIFPHFWNERLVGWQNRWMDWDHKHTKTPRWLAKYTNTRDFPKSTTLFNYDEALEAQEPVIVCESVATVLMLASLSLPAVAFFGGGIKEDQLKLLRRLQCGVILAPDNDDKGDKLLTTATKYLQQYIDVLHLPKVTDYGEGGDLGDFASEFKRDKLRRVVHNFVNLAHEPEVI